MGPKKIAGGDVSKPQFLTQPLCLGALSGPGSAEQDNIHDHTRLSP